MPGYGITDAPTGMLPWSWAEERLTQSQNYWLSTVRPDGLPHLMAVWCVWWQGALWFSTGHRSRKARNLAAQPRCSISTERADEPVIVEGLAVNITDSTHIAQMGSVYSAKYGEFDPDIGLIYRVQPIVAFAFIEHEDQFASAATRWTFDPQEKP
jgi:hypothetical protein